MGKYSDALEKSTARLREENLFQYKDIVIDGKIHSPIICEKRMLRILNFKGSGPKMKFFDIYRIVDELFDKELERCWNKGGLKQSPWIDDFIIDNNIQVIFEEGDVKLKISKTS